jgi:transposase
MLTQGESVEAHALRERGWSVSAIARHLGRDRKTVRAYLSGKREPGRRRPAAPDRFERYEAYCRIRVCQLNGVTSFPFVTCVPRSGGRQT